MVKDIVRIRKYEQGGDEKVAYDNVGILIIKDDGKMSIKMNSVPVEWDGWLSVFDKKRGNKPDETSDIMPF